VSRSLSSRLIRSSRVAFAPEQLSTKSRNSGSRRPRRQDRVSGSSDRRRAYATPAKSCGLNLASKSSRPAIWSRDASSPASWSDMPARPSQQTAEAGLPARSRHFALRSLKAVMPILAPSCGQAQRAVKHCMHAMDIVWSSATVVRPYYRIEVLILILTLTLTLTLTITQFTGMFQSHSLCAS
jgi:hypothetical protein